ncbi:hypothetical protein NQ314_004217 [Rhamnusium bicolor]|uniref:DDE Tnp4 domain-containing protein n=1 Tax=Rhamnusium bicolor TaxID=1586634 RepID=A0AAV8ZN82_9CUCU|nr:hypothetical protein NQ314_004217 [Rhamnusium bicolor]
MKEKDPQEFFNIVLLAAYDVDYNFILIDVGAYGSQSDGGIFKESAFGVALDMGSLNIPESSPISNNISVPYVFVADEAFPQKSYIMRPFPG